MAEENWQQIRKIFDDALRLKPEERGPFVCTACGEDAALRKEVESLLDSLDDAESFLEMPAVAHVAESIEPESVRFQPGKHFNHYEIIEKIGAGGMGEIYLASDSKLDRKVAVKILNEKFSRDESNLKRFVSEAKAASALNHPNILVIHEIGAEDGVNYIVSEFVKGRTLRELMRREPMKLTEILDAAVQVAGALSAAHDARLVHRDIKPENVVVRPDGFVKVLDFGLAKLIGRKNRSVLGLDESAVEDHQTAKGVILGTVNYMSPEQAKGEHVDERTDIFSLGVLIYEMIAQRTPFAGGSVSETFANLINQDPAPLSEFAANVPAELQRIIAKMLRKNPDERYQSMRDVHSDLKEFRENLAAEAKLERSISPNATGLLSATTGGGTRHSTAATLGAISQSIKRNKPLTVFLSFGLLAGLLALGSSFIPFQNADTALSGKKSIAVLPVRPINAGIRDEMYEIGIADSLIHRLSMVKGFVVRPLSAVRKYADIGQDPLAAGKEQQVDYVLTSNYQVANGKVRLTVQLVDVRSGQIEETNRIEKEAGNIFAIQDAVAAEVGDLLQARFAVASASRPDDRGTGSEEAYRLYLQAMYLLDKFSFADTKRAIELFDEALRLDPNYAKAWAGKARAHCHSAHFGGSTPDVEYTKARPALEKAFALDAELPEAHAIHGVIEADYDWDFDESNRRFSRAIELSPNSDLFYALFGYHTLSRQGRWDEAIAKAKTAVDLNPNYVVNQAIYGQILYLARRYDEAIVQLERAIDMEPTRPYAYYFLWRAHLKNEDHPRAYETLMKVLRLTGSNEETLKGLDTLYVKGGFQSVLLRLLENLKVSDKNGSAAYLKGELSAMLDLRDQAFLYLDEAAKKRSLQFPNIRIDPTLDSIRGETRFDELLAQVRPR